jgi:hypothetical protein
MIIDIVSIMKPKISELNKYLKILITLLIIKLPIVLNIELNLIKNNFNVKNVTQECLILMEKTDGPPDKLNLMKSVMITGSKILKKHLLVLIMTNMHVKNIPENILLPLNN